MRIGIDISQTAFRGTGVDRFTRGLIQSVLLYGTDHTWVFFYSSLRTPIDEELKKQIVDSENRLVAVPIPPTLMSFLWNTLHVVPIETFVGQIDRFISSDWTEPPSHCRKATIVHDLTVFTYPKTVHPSILSTQKKRLSWVKSESGALIADSHATERDVSKYLPDCSEKVTTIYPGVTIQTPDAATIASVKKKFHIDKPFVLTVGKTEPRKNLPRLIEAFNGLQTIEYELLIAGPKGWDTTMEKMDLSRTRLLGMVTDTELHALYSLCTVFAYPSLWEGFGYPVVEAMKHGKPVLTSNTSSLIEVGAKGALLCNPESVTDIQNGLTKLLTQQELRTSLSNEGIHFAEQFSWQSYYQSLMKILI